MCGIQTTKPNVDQEGFVDAKPSGRTNTVDAPSKPVTPPHVVTSQKGSAKRVADFFKASETKNNQHISFPKKSKDVSISFPKKSGDVSQKKLFPKGQ